MLLTIDIQFNLVMTICVAVIPLLHINAAADKGCDSAAIFRDSDLTGTLFNTGVNRFWDRPVKNAYSPISVYVKFQIRGLIDVEERSEMVRVSANIYQAWQDEIHVWNETQFRCTEFVFVPHGELTGVWLPDVAFMNAESKYGLTRNPDELVRIQSDGYSTFAPGGIFDFHCSFDLSLFPFDIQKCAVEFESWRHPIKYQAFEEPGIDFQNMTEHKQWEVIEINYERTVLTYFNGLSFGKVIFYINLRRKPGYYVATVILPCLVVSAVEVATFAIPYDKGIRIEVSFTCLLSFSVFMTSVANEMPRSADHPPLLLTMICFIFVYIGVAIVLQGICLLLTQKARRCDAVPSFLLNMSIVAGQIVGLPTRLIYEDRLSSISSAIPNSGYSLAGSIVETKKLSLKRRHQYEWHLVAATVDRYSVLIFTISLALTNICMLGIVPNVKS